MIHAMESYAYSLYMVSTVGSANHFFARNEGSSNTQLTILIEGICIICSPTSDRFPYSVAIIHARFISFDFWRNDVVEM